MEGRALPRRGVPGLIYVCLIIAVVIAFSYRLAAAPVVTNSKQLLFQDSFTGGKPELEWAPFPHFNLDNLHGAIDTSSPEGEPGVGILDNKKVGGFAALSYAKTQPLADFYLETWIFTQVLSEHRAPLNGIAFRVDPKGDRFYRVACKFTGEPALTLAYVGKDTNHFPVYLAQWKELPGEFPKQSGWHKLAIEINKDDVEVYWNGVKLPGGPFRADRTKEGFIGVYANVTGGMGIAETKVDGLQVWRNK